MIKLSDIGANEHEIAYTIVKAINAVGVEQTILSLMRPLKKKELDAFKELLKVNNDISFKLYEKVKKTKIPRYLVNINVLSKDVQVNPISREIELEFQEFTFESENNGETEGAE